ncbi:MAG: nuclease A inhibitor family protein [Ferruginibacter sp.]
MASTKKNVSGTPAKSSNTTKATALSKLCYELEKASADLTYQSESDYPYQFFALQQRSLHEESDKLTPLEFLGCIGLSEELMNDLKIPIDELIEERSLDDFFPTLEYLAESGGGLNDPDVIALSRRYRKLEKLLKKRLQEVKIFRVGAVDVRCYIAGFFNEGNIAGLVTISIET